MLDIESLSLCYGCQIMSNSVVKCQMIEESLRFIYDKIKYIIIQIREVLQKH